MKKPFNIISFRKRKATIIKDRCLSEFVNLLKDFWKDNWTSCDLKERCTVFIVLPLELLLIVLGFLFIAYNYFLVRPWMGIAFVAAILIYIVVTLKEKINRRRRI